MKLNIKDTLEILGVASIVLSLVFFGVQLSLDRNIALADSYAMGIEARKSDLRSLLESESYMIMADAQWDAGIRPFWWSDEIKPLEDYALVSGSQIHTFYYSTMLNLLEIDSTYFRYQQGLIDESYWIGARNSLSFLLRDPFSRRAALTIAAPLRSVAAELWEEIESANGT